jgi:transposase
MWAIVSRNNDISWATTELNINAEFVFNQLETKSFQIRKPTVIALDNATIHKAKIIQNQLPIWQKRGLFIFYLPPYSPHLNLAETLWRKIKKEQIDHTDYLNKDTLFYAVNRCLAQFGVGWKIKFSEFNIN